MSSGINWKYRVKNNGKDGEKAPVEFKVGVSWASNGSSHFTIGHIRGLSAVRQCYTEVPGLGGGRQRWLSQQLDGPRKVVHAAAKYQLDLFARSVGKKTPLSHGGGRNLESKTLGSWIEAYGFFYGKEIAEFAEIDLNMPFLECWQAFALASEEWPMSKWNPHSIASKVREGDLVVTKIGRFGEKEAISAELRDQVLEACRRWSNTDPRDTTEGKFTPSVDLELINLIKA